MLLEPSKAIEFETPNDGYWGGLNHNPAEAGSGANAVFTSCGCATSTGRVTFIDR